MEALKVLNLGIRFLLEILSLIILGYWGFKFFEGVLLKILFGIGTPLLVAILWGTFGSPKAPYPLYGISFLLFEVVIFGLAPIALYVMGKDSLASVFGLIVIINIVLMKIWNQ